MGKPGFARKRGLKRVNSSKPFKKFKNLKLNLGAEKLVPKQPLENDSEDWSDENSEAELETKEEEVEEDIVFNRKPTMYDNLLKRLGSSSQLIANAIKQRKRGEEGKSDTEDDESESEVEDDNEGSIDESPRSIEMINGAKESGVPGYTEKSEDSGSDDGEIGASDSDKEHDSRTNVESITSRSTFSSHLEYKLSQGEVDNLFKRKWNYKWEVPALRAPNCKWRGTGDCFLKVDLFNYNCWLICQFCPYLFHNHFALSFTEEFGSGGVESEEEDEDVENSKRKKSSKPSDFQSLFGGNNNDHFMIGIKYMGRKIKLYADFYSSDIIVASPLGLITKIGAVEVEKEKDIDYLSSIEVLIIDHADVILMQNWSHVNTVVEQLNRLPVKQHGTDIMRIQPWYLDGQAQFYRQTIILGSHLNPDINSLFNRHCLNYEGKVKLVCLYKGVLPKVLIPVRQIYERFEADSIADVDDARFQYFCKKVFPKIKDSIQGGIMLCISSYFEFVRLRNFLKSQEALFCLLGEYTKQSDISRGRVWFFQGQRKIMLYTERAHFYHRYKVLSFFFVFFLVFPTTTFIVLLSQLRLVGCKTS
ncbi:unnamed protein product [Coffea canephora]|uniref:Uncharacterized protein n=1 Tax=Coffea canephora TaxID=49390 RepID=A0A068V9P7_COFCA|nr:unnamed protein product [Coffea canephora]